MNDLNNIAEEIRIEMDARNMARDSALITSRETIRFCANSIRALHRGQYDEAADLLKEARQRVLETKKELQEFPDLYYAGYVLDAQKEYVEAETMNSFIRDLPIPSSKELGVESAPFLNGVAEAVSECRRSVLDTLRKGDMERAERLLSRMDDTFYILMGFDYPDAITGGLRRTMDQARAVLERTRGDLTVSIRQNDLELAINRAVEVFIREE